MASRHGYPGARSRLSLPAWGGVLAFAALILSPLLALVLSSDPALANPAGLLPLAVPAGRTLVLFINSLLLAVCVSLAATALGWSVAVSVWASDSRHARNLLLALFPLCALPPYLHAQAWMHVSEYLSDISQAWSLAPIQLQGWPATAWVEVASFWPIAMAAGLLGLRAVDPDLVEAARLATPDLRVVLRVASPLAAPAVLTGAGIVFLLSFLDYSVPSLFQVHVYAMEVFAEFSASNSASQALAVAAPMILTACLVVALILRPIRSLTIRAVHHRAAWRALAHWPKGAASALYAARGLLMVFAAAPVAMLAVRSGGAAGVLASLADARQEVLFSALTAGAAACLGVGLGHAASGALQREGSAVSLLWFLLLLPAAIPASLVGIGWSLMGTRLAAWPEITGIGLPALACLTRFASLAVLADVACARRSDPALWDAARLFQHRTWRRILWVHLPLRAPGLLTGLGVVFALSMGELGATLMVAPPGQASLTMRIYNYLHYGSSEVVAGLSLALVLAVLAGAGLAALVGAGFGRRLAAVEEAA